MKCINELMPLLVMSFGKKIITNEILDRDYQYPNL